MKLLRVLAWISLALGCVAIAIAEAPTITGVEAVGVTVSDLDRSVQFFTEVLRFQKEWEKELSGMDVEHLKGVFGARVRVARLRLGNEDDARANDLAHWETLVEQDDVNSTWYYFSKNHQRLISSRVEHIGDRSGFLFTDPDGHVLEAVSPANTQALHVQGR